MCVSAQRHYAGDTRAPAAARMFGHAAVVSALEPGGWALADDAALVISELVTDAVERGARGIELAITLHFDNVTITLTHDRPGAGWARPTAPGGTAERAMRQHIIASLARAQHTTDEEADRRCTQVELRADPRFAARLACERRPAD
jgi:hypothetical protein